YVTSEHSYIYKYQKYLQDEEPNDHKIGKLCEYALKKPLRILKARDRGTNVDIMDYF
ncbi:hypothetical protein G4B88_030015, partial [Cannabis sativa]